MKPHTTTPGGRLAKWQAIHKQLLRDDLPYRKRHSSFLITAVCLACIMLPFYLPFFGVRLFGFAMDVSIVSCAAAAIVVSALRQLLYQSHRIHGYLKSNHDA